MQHLGTEVKTMYLQTRSNGWTVESALENQHIHGTRRFLSEHHFFVGRLTQRITIRLYRSLERNWIEYDQSHFIHTPVQIDAYQPSTPFGDDEGEALHTVVFSLTQWYEQAVREGHEPNDSWLEKNPHFN
jgi:hypothetical protein